ncbi:MAG: PaaX family transcriptional regulator [Patulibacter sp.]|nr:PaaX family transcriptional regulator [Patulibacter sp.]
MPPRSDSPRREHPGPPRASTEAQPQELIVTIFAAYVGSDPRPAWSGGLVDLLGAFGYSAGAARIALNRVVERQLLERHREGRFISYSPTPRLLELIAVGERRLRTLALDAPWDGTWTLVWYSIPEEQRRERHRLGRRLRFLGFGPLEDSTWVAPRDHAGDVDPYLERLGVRNLTGMFVGRQATPPEAIIARAWDREELVKRYRLFLDEFSPYRDRSLTDDEAFVVRTRLANTYRRFPYLDPGLPRDVFPAADERKQAATLYEDLLPALEPAARRHFDGASRRGPAPTPAATAR